MPKKDSKDIKKRGNSNLQEIYDLKQQQEEIAKDLDKDLREIAHLIS